MLTVMNSTLLREVIPLTQNDCFTIFNRHKARFDLPLYHYDEFELNLIQNAKGAKRVFGDHVEEIEDIELAFAGPNLQHGWFTHRCSSEDITEITIRFHRHLLDEKFLQRNQLSFIRSMFERSSRGILFSRETAQAIMPRMAALTKKYGFDSVLELLSILHELSMSKNFRILSDACFNGNDMYSFHSRRIQTVMEYLHKNFNKEASLGESAKIVSMTEVAFSRFFKLRTGKTFMETLIDIRLGHASRLLIETTESITEIAYKCGFNNLSNFNRLFKKKKHWTPTAFRDAYSCSGVRAFG